MTLDQFSNLFALTYSTKLRSYEVLSVKSWLEAERNSYLKNRPTDWLVVGIFESEMEANNQLREIEGGRTNV